MQLPTGLSIPAPNTGKDLLNLASGGLWATRSVQMATLHYQQLLSHQALVLNCATVNHGDAGRAAIGDSGVQPANTSETVIAGNENKKNETSHADRQSGSATDQLSNGQQRGLVCEHCNIGFVYERTLVRHKKMVHDEKERVLPQCPVCHKKSRHPNVSLIHERTLHGNCQSSFVCGICSQLLSTKRELIQHRSIHAEIKKFQCVFCSDAFTKSSDLRRHKKCHFVGVRAGRFQCGVCDKLFCYKYKRDAHQKVHDEGRGKKCDECGEDFVGKTELARHRITRHGKGELHSCMLCDSELASEKSLRKHYINCHGVVKNVAESLKTSACKDANMHVNTDAECKEVTACSKAEKRKACSESEVESTCSESETESACSESETESTCGESEKGIICNEHAKEMPEDLKDHRHFPGKMTSRWIALFSAPQQ